MYPPKSRSEIIEELKAGLKEVGITDGVDEIIPLLVRDAVEMRLEAKDEMEIPIGASKFGGRPDLPLDMDWPWADYWPLPAKDPEYKYDWEPGPLNFIGQINLKDLAGFSLPKKLPDSGILYFFYETEEQVGHLSQNNLRGWRVIYLEEKEESLKRRDLPEGVVEKVVNREANQLLQPCLASFLPKVTIADIGAVYQWEDMEGLFGDADNGDDDPFFIKYLIDFDELIEKKLMTEYGSHDRNQIGGFPYPEGENMTEKECHEQLYELGIEKEEERSVPDMMEDWFLLLQLDSLSTLNRSWSLDGKLFFFIRDKDLQEKDFDKALFLLKVQT